MNLLKDIKFSAFSGGFSNAFRRAGLSAVEIAFLIAALAFGAFVAYFYLTQVQPLSSQLATLNAKELEVSAKIQKNKKDNEAKNKQESNAEKIIESLNRFQELLKSKDRGTTQIINEINTLGLTHKLLSDGASYRPIEAEPTVDENGDPLPAQKLAEKKINIYPALGVDTTVVGDYPNLRRFLSDLERSRQFLVIKSLTFQGGDDKLVRAAAKGGKPFQLSTPEAIPVSVKIELDAYFQAPSYGEKQN